MDESKRLLLNDGGAKSRKLWLTIGCLLGAVASGALTGPFPALATAYPTLCATIVALLTVYCGGNVAAKVALGRVPKKPLPPEEPPDRMQGE